MNILYAFPCNLVYMFVEVNLLSVVMPRYFIVSACCSFLLLMNILISCLFLGFFFVIIITFDLWSLKLVLFLAQIATFCLSILA